MTAITSAEAFPAGEFLADELDARGWTQTDFAEVIGRPVQFVSEIINGKKEITRESASQIGAALGTSAQLWLNLQDTYHLWKQDQDSRTQTQLNDVRLRSKMFAKFPIGVLVQRGFIHQTDPAQQAADICRLYDISSIDDESSFALAARKSDVLEPLSSLQQAWFVCVRDRAHGRHVNVFDRDALVSLAEQLPHRLKSSNAFSQLPALLAEVGVHLIYLETFPTSKLDGGAQFVDGNPVIGLSGRGKRLDIVLFTLMHEIAHVVLGHASNSVVVDDDNDHVEPGAVSGIEDAANALAGRWIFPQGLPDTPARVSGPWVAAEADRLDIHPIVLVGRLQKLGQIPWRTALVKNAPSVGDVLESWG